MEDDALRNGELFDRAAATRRSAEGGLPVLSVSRFIAAARLALERNLGLLWIGGEVSGCTRAASGHFYFTLKDSNAQVRCVFFRQKAQALGFALRDGLAVEVRAMPSIYDARGEFQLNVETIRLAGLGALYERFLRLKATLQEAGLFDSARKRPVPRYPRRIGIVTSRHAAALRDVLTTLTRRFPCAPVILYPAPVQGMGAGAEIAAAIRRANAHAHVDVLIVCRGGGSLEDLWAFNEEAVARAIHASIIPVVSGVGHEADFTICDFVADVRAPTPTGAASLVAPERSRVRQMLADVARRMARAHGHGVENRVQRLDVAARRLVHPAARLARQADDARRLGQRLTRAFRHGLAIDARRLHAVEARLCRELRVPPPQAQRIDQMARALKRAGEHRIVRASEDIARLSATLSLLNPQAVLERGYAIVTSTAGIVSDARQIAPGQSVALTFARGSANATVTSTAPDNAPQPNDR